MLWRQRLRDKAAAAADPPAKQPHRATPARRLDRRAGGKVRRRRQHARICAGPAYLLVSAAKRMWRGCVCRDAEPRAPVNMLLRSWRPCARGRVPLPAVRCAGRKRWRPRSSRRRCCLSRAEGRQGRGGPRKGAVAVGAEIATRDSRRDSRPAYAGHTRGADRSPHAPSARGSARCNVRPRARWTPACLQPAPQPQDVLLLLLEIGELSHRPFSGECFCCRALARLACRMLCCGWLFSTEHSFLFSFTQAACSALSFNVY